MKTPSLVVAAIVCLLLLFTAMTGFQLTMTGSRPASSSRDVAAWRSLVGRSLAAWVDIARSEERADRLLGEIFESYSSLDDFLSQAGDSAMFWFFQRRRPFELQEGFQKWSPNNLDDYILLPASKGFVLRRDCFFVSHYWDTTTDPDPQGKTLRLQQQTLAHQAWKYIWVDWTCMPQEPRSDTEEHYFTICLHTMSGIIRNCAFTYHYPPWQPKLWILYEIAEFVLTCSDESTFYKAPDIQKFRRHIGEMVATSVRKVLEQRRYGCSYGRDKRFLTSWLELLVLLKRLQLHIDLVRNLMDGMTWQPSTPVIILPNHELELRRFEGVLSLAKKVYTFTPFPQWVSARRL